MMDIYAMNIYIAGDKALSDLMAVLEKTELPEGVACKIHRLSSLKTEKPEAGSVVIFSGAEMVHLCPLYAIRCRMVYYCDEEELTRLDKSVLNQLTAVWVMPLSAKILNFSFSRLIRSMKDKYDAQLYKNLLNTTIETSPDMVWVKDTEGLHRLVNSAFCKVVHKTKENVVGKGHCYIWDVPPEENEKGEYACRESDNAVVKARKTCVFEEAVKTKDGMKQLRTYKSPIFDADGVITGTVGIARDVTDISNMGAELDILIENLPFPIIVCSKNWDIVKYNLKSRLAFDIDKSETGKDYKTWKSRRFGDSADGDKRNDGSSYDEVTLYDDCRSKTFSLMEHAITDSFGYVSGYFCVFSDITAEKLYEKDLLHLVNTDELTQLYNRRYFFEYTNKYKNENMTLFFMDMDNFKAINDTYGHKFGDAVLVKTADIIKKAFPDGLAVRIGGDEFVAVLRGKKSRVEVKNTAELLMRRVEETFNGQPSAGKISISIGVSQTDGSDKDIDTLIVESDMQMYRQKGAHGEFRMPLRSETRSRKSR